MGRRATDQDDSSNAFRAILFRAVASAVVALVLGAASGLLSAYVMVQVMQERIDGVRGQIDGVKTRMDHLENRFNNLTDDYYRRNNR